MFSRAAGPTCVTESAVPLAPEARCGRASAAALIHAIIRLRPLPARNALYGAAIVTGYMDAAGETVDPPYGALIDLARDIDAGRADGYDAADRIRSWRI